MYVIKKIKNMVKRGMGPAPEWEDSFHAAHHHIKVTEQALEAARRIRGDRPPAIIIHGVMPRSGTVYTGELLRLHPDLYAYPNEMWETPFLELTGDILRTQEHFIRAYKQNTSRMGEKDFLPLFGASFIAYLYSFVPAGKQMLLKIPDVQYLNYFFAVFPHETPLLLLRDGRDLVASTIKSWPGKRFDDVCRLWAESTAMMLAFQRQYPQEASRYLTIKYEDVVSAPEAFVATACAIYGLDPAVYPYERIKDLPIRGSSTVKQARDREVSWSPVDKPESFSPVGHWRNWTARQKGTFKKIAGKALIDAGYCQSLDW